MYLKQSLSYVFQGNGRFRPLFILTLVQLIPVIGQLILVGYGMAVARAVNRGDVDLPPIKAGQALGDGARLIGVGLIFLLPVLMIIPMILTSGTGDGGSLAPLILPLAILAVSPILGRAVKDKPKLKPLVTAVGGIVMITILGSAIFQLSQLSASDFDLTHFSLNPIGMILLAIMAVLLFVIFTALHVIGVRYAVTGEGLFQPNQLIAEMANHRSQTARLAFDLLVLGLLATVSIGLGMVLFVLPGLVATAVFTIALWHIFTLYGMEIGLTQKE